MGSFAVVFISRKAASHDAAFLLSLVDLPCFSMNLILGELKELLALQHFEEECLSVLL